MKFDDKLFLASRIKYHRQKKGLTQAELAEKVGLSVQHVSRIESAYYIPSLVSFFMIVDVLEIDLREFGFDIESTKNERKDKLVDTILQASETELTFYENIINSVKQSITSLRK